MGSSGLTFELFRSGTSYLPSVDRLDASLTINGTTVTPTFRYKGGDADATNWDQWTYGETLTSVGTAGTFNAGSPLLGSNDDSFSADVTRYYKATTSFADVTTEDMVIELVFKFDGTINRRVGGTWDSTSGYMLFNVNATDLVFYLDDGPNTASVIADGLDADTWYHIIWFIDKSGSGVAYVNGSAKTAAVVSGVGSVTGNVLNIGAGDDSFVWGTNIAYMAMWQQDAWLDTHLQPTIAQERFLKLTGFYPQVAKGTEAPTVMTRASQAYLDKTESGVRKLYQVGDNWLRYCSRIDSEATAINGYLPEVEVENLCIESETFGAWGTLNNLTVSANQIAAPNKTTTADILKEDATAADTHNIDSAVIAKVDATVYTVSVFAKAINRDWIAIVNGADPSASAYFNITNGTVGTESNATGYIENWEDGWFRCSIVFTSTATDNTNYTIYIAEDDNDVVFDGLNQNSVYVWGAQFEVGDYATSYIPTVASAVTRSADSLVYKGDDGNITNNQVGTLKMNFLFPDYPSENNLRFFNLTDGGDTANQFDLLTKTTNRLDLNVRATGGDPGDITITKEFTDNIVHSTRLTWKTDEASVYLDDANIQTDTSVGIPDDLDEIDVGQRVDNTGQLGAIISEFAIYNKIRKP
jgi:hypothetical protein